MISLEKFISLANRIKDIGDSIGDPTSQYMELRDEWWEVLLELDYREIVSSIKQCNLKPLHQGILCYLITTLALESSIKRSERRGEYN